jgi:CRP/FNR family cyclic AMP-dependent transcriptional regulator
LSTTSSHSQILILKIAQPGEVLGLNTTVSRGPHEARSETGQSWQLNFLKRDDFLKFLTEHTEASMQAAVHLSYECQQAYQHLRSFVMRSDPQRIARLILDWSHEYAGRKAATRIKVALTHEEIGQIIGMSRETFTRT